MGYETTANDWEFAGLCQIGGAETVGGGFYQFKFRSRTAGIEAFVYFGGAGIGIGGGIGGASGSDFSNGQPSFTAMRCDRRFSLRDLHNANGRVTAIGVSLAVGYGQVYISAASGFDTLFSSQGGHGLSVGVGIGATNFYGLWRVGEVSNIRR